MRRLLAVVSIAVVGVVLGGASLAGAQTTTTTTIPFTCNFTLSTTSLPVGGGPVQVSGTAPADTAVHISVNGVEVPGSPVQSSNTTGAWGPITVTITETSTIVVTLGPGYPATTCLGPGTVSVATAQAAAALPRTGSNDTKPFVLIGLVVLLVGAVLVLATRRRERTRGRI